MIVQALLVGVTVCLLDFLDVWLCNPMITRPLVVGTAMGIALGDITTGVQVGASLELVFMGVMAIGGTVPPDSIHGTAVGAAYAIILGKGIETAIALAVPASIVCQMLFVPGIGIRSLFTPYVERQVEKGNWKALLQTGEYEVLPAGSIDATDQSLYASNQNADYRNVWEYDRDAVEKIKDSIDEINIYDEELDVDFLVHVTLPPDYDNSKTYPVFFLTDGVWRFGNCTELRSVMENGEAAPVILVSLGYDYNIDGTDNDNRITYFIQKGSMLLDFITDNLMPYLGENYSIDYTNSTLYGHSNGGVFTHEALFQSDLYENQPFGNYIIGSPAFWNLYHEELGVDPEDYSNDYGYFDRNDTLDKKVFLCGGTLEDSDYSEYYNGHDTTLEGLEKLNQRLESHNANVTYQLYHTHHYQYIPEMLTAYLKQTYPVT